jgi:hypothetical protein
MSHDKFLGDVITLEFTPDAGYTAPAIGDMVEFTAADNTVKKVATAGSENVVGRVCSIRTDKRFNGTIQGVTVETAAIALQTFVAGSTIAAPGSVVLDASGNAIPYVEPLYAGGGSARSTGHAPNAIIGLAITSAASGANVQVLRFK